jgi:alpha-galactosidase
MLTAASASAETIWLDALNLKEAVQGSGQPCKNRSVYGESLVIAGEKFARGFGTHSESRIFVNLAGGARSFTAAVGVDDAVKDKPQASVEFYVVGDGKVLWQSGVMKSGDAARRCHLNVAGVTSLLLKVGDADDGIAFDHADWADARFEAAGSQSFSTSCEPMAPAVAPYILTPRSPASPRINGARVAGVRPGSPFLFAIPATGERPMKFSVMSLPPGLKLDPNTGCITGTLKKRGEFVVTLRAQNARGRAEKKLRIVCGDQIALTPPMGWNSWNCFADVVSADKVKAAADAMVKSGLINHGWTYINIDDFWQVNPERTNDPSLQGPARAANGSIRPNPRFPDMRELTDYVHDRGLKIGLYSSPGEFTCGGCVGSYQHEDLDAQQYARWGFDYLKYDFCTYWKVANQEAGGGPSNYTLGIMQKPYRLMEAALQQADRDIVYSLCQYGMGEVWKWGGQVGGHCWRTTGDIKDTWKSVSEIGFHQDIAAPFAKPGNWNDPDMLVVGQVGWGNPHPTRLTTDEQYTHISLWCLLSAPLLIGCDMEKLDDFTLSLLTNDEVLAIDQDALGRQATCVVKDGDLRVYQKVLEDGGHAVGFFNLGLEPVLLTFKDFAKLGLGGRLRVRDLWRQSNAGEVDTVKGNLPLAIPAHGVVLYKLTSEP